MVDHFQYNYPAVSYKLNKGVYVYSLRSQEYFKMKVDLDPGTISVGHVAFHLVYLVGCGIWSSGNQLLVLDCVSKNMFVRTLCHKVSITSGMNTSLNLLFGERKQYQEVALATA